MPPGRRDLRGQRAAGRADTTSTTARHQGGDQQEQEQDQDQAANTATPRFIDSMNYYIRSLSRIGNPLRSRRSSQVSTSRASSPTAGTSTSRSSRPAGAPAGRALLARSAAGPRSARRAGRPRRGLAPPVGVDEHRAVGVGVRLHGPGQPGHRAGVAAAACPRPAPRPGPAAPGTGPAPASSPAAGPPHGGSSRVQVTGREVGTCSPTTTTSTADSVAASDRSSSVTPSISIEALSTPPIRAAVPPASTTAPEAQRLSG